MAIPPNPVGRAVVIIAVVFTAVDLGFVLLRLWARRLKRVKLDASDYLIIVAWVRCQQANHRSGDNMKLIFLF
jgi:hypothetical protein